MQNNTSTFLLNEPQALVPLLPMVYLAWADGIITPSERHAILSVCQEQDWVSEADYQQLEAWLNPQTPPSATEYQRWYRALRFAGTLMDTTQTLDLPSLSAALLQVTGIREGRLNEAEKRALQDIEAVLGIVVPEAYRDLWALKTSEETPTKTEDFNTEAITQLFDSTYPELRYKIRTLLQDPFFKPPLEPNREAYREQVLGWLKELAKHKLGALAYPQAYGGQHSIEQFMVTFEMLAYGDLSMTIKFGVQFGLFGGSVHQLGTEKHHQKYLKDIGNLTLPGCFAMTELGHGSNVRDIETVARYDVEKESFFIHTPHHGAHKEYIGNAAKHGQMATVFAQLIIAGENYGVHAFLVPIRNQDGSLCEGVTIEDSGFKMGLNGVDNGKIWFHHVQIPRENLLDRFAQVDADGTYHSHIPSASKRFFTMLGTLVGGRISVASAALSAAKKGLTITIRYNDQRRQFGPKNQPEVSILDYLTQQRRLLPLLANAYALDFSLKNLQRRFAEKSNEEEMEKIEGLAAGLKAYSTWNTTETLQTGRECCGGQGYMAKNQFASLKADTDIFTTFEGDNTVLLLQLAKGLLSQYKKSFHDLNFFGMLRYLAQEASTVIREKNPIMTHLTDEEHLRSSAFHLSLFKNRSHDLLQSVAKRLKSRIDGGMDSYEAFIQCQDHLVTLAKAEVEYQLLIQFVEGISGVQEEVSKKILEKMSHLFALSQLEKNRAWFLEHGYLDDNKSRAIKKQVNKLCQEIRPYAVSLVNAFNIPDACLNAPIAL